MVSLDKRDEGIFEDWDIGVEILEGKSNFVLQETYKRDIWGKYFMIGIGRVKEGLGKTIGWSVDSISLRGNIKVRDNCCYVRGKNSYLKAYSYLIDKIDKLNQEARK